MSTIRRSSRSTRVGIESSRQVGAPQPTAPPDVAEVGDVDPLEHADGETRSGLDGDGGGANVLLSNQAMDSLLDDLLADMSDEEVDAETEQAQDYGRTGRHALRGGTPEFRDDGSTAPTAFDSQQLSALETMTLRRGERAPNLRGAQEAKAAAAANGPKSILDAVADTAESDLEVAIDRVRRIRAQALSSPDSSGRLVAAQASIAEMDARAELAESGTMSIHDLLRATQIPTVDVGELSTHHEIAGRYEANAGPEPELSEEETATETATATELSNEEEAEGDIPLDGGEASMDALLALLQADEG